MCSILYMSMLAFHPNALFGPTEQQGCFQALCPAQREGRSLYRDCHARSARKANAASDRASPFPIHVLNWALVFGQYLILDLKDVWCVQFIYLGGIKFSAAPIYSLNVFLQESPLIPDPWNFWVVFFPALTELYPVMFVFPPSWLSFQVFDSSFS